MDFDAIIDEELALVDSDSENCSVSEEDVNDLYANNCGRYLRHTCKLSMHKFMYSTHSGASSLEKRGLPQKGCF